MPQVAPTPPAGVPGIYHRVAKGETLWRISKVYDVDLEELTRINRIPDSTNIEIGQLIFIPHRKKMAVSVIPAGEDFIWPIKGKVIAGFNQTVNNMINKGVNIQPYSDMNVLAARAGRVVFYSPDFKGFGKTIILDHGDGFLTAYSRNADIFVKISERVSQGAVIARVGSAGRDKNRYLHFEIRKGCISQNPYFYLP